MSSVSSSNDKSGSVPVTADLAGRDGQAAPLIDIEILEWPRELAAVPKDVLDLI
jgi:hypothetical protein